MHDHGADDYVLGPCRSSSLFKLDTRAASLRNADGLGGYHTLLRLSSQDALDRESSSVNVLLDYVTVWGAFWCFTFAIFQFEVHPHNAASWTNSQKSPTAVYRLFENNEAKEQSMSLRDILWLALRHTTSSLRARTQVRKQSSPMSHMLQVLPQERSSESTSRGAQDSEIVR